MSTKRELVQEFQAGKMNKESFGYNALSYTGFGLVICKVVYGINDSVFGYEFINNEYVFFLLRLYTSDSGTYFIYKGQRQYLDNFIRNYN
ncbi:hypothetical protein [Bacillus sp. NPDC094106]|uniref:hypothetical protein n=1 Tax=Bacillus sp. NPDC094106 TaxID=3363949 RepID=UPI00381DAEEF